MRPVRCVLALSLILSCTSKSTLTTDPSCTGVGCLPGGGDAGPTVRDGSLAGEQQHEQIYELNPVRDLDILFMIDNSPSMQEEQDKLNASFPVFMNELKRIEGGLPNVHVAAISSDLGAGPRGVGTGACARIGGDRGIFQVGTAATRATCGLDANSLFATSLNNGTQNNFGMRDISQVFTCMAGLGARGCGYEHQLQATRVALYETITPENKGFLRKDAFLALILLTDEDDCSAETSSTLFNNDALYPNSTASFRCAQTGHVCDGKTPPNDVFEAPLETCKPNDTDTKLIKVTEIVDSIRALKSRPDQQILVSGIIGMPDNPTGAKYRYTKTREGTDLAPICSAGVAGDAMPGLRMKAFVESFGASGSVYSICDHDFAPALKHIGGKVASKLGNVCISAPLVDTAPDAGLQPDCQVVDRIPGAGGFKDEPLPPCSSGSRSASGACWQLVADVNCDASGFKIDVDRGGNLPTPGTQQVIRCITCSKTGDPRCRR